MNDTIAAISTALGIGSISIIRVSGEKAIESVNEIFRGKDLRLVQTHTITYGHIVAENQIIDEVLVTIMRSPKSFTTEDIVEINCHGGVAPTHKILECLIKKEVRLAEPGEFTKRAFLNGRIDLLEAEGIMDLIESKTEKMRKIAINQVGGKVSKLIHSLRDEIVEVISHIEVNIDYPEYEDIKDLTNQDLIVPLKKVQEEIKHILEESKQSKIIKEGILTSIIGRPNVGKSSLLNSLLEEDKAIVTDIPGTTRDMVEGSINIDGILLNVIDTAGIRETSDEVESIGVQKSYDLLEKAELILFVLNNNESLTEEDKDILKRLQGKNHIILVNKVDLDKNLNEEEIQEEFIYMSTINNIGFMELKDKIKNLYHLEKLEQIDPTYLTNARSIALLKKAKVNIDKALLEVQRGTPIDILEMDVKEAWLILGEIIGETYTDELIDQLFSRFCLGK